MEDLDEPLLSVRHAAVVVVDRGWHRVAVEYGQGMTCPHCKVARPDHEPLRCTKRKLGPNMKRLMTRFMAVDAVSPGGGLASAAAFFLDSERMRASARKAFGDAVTAVVAVRSAPDFASLGLPDDAEETIAVMLVRRLEEANEQIAKRHRLDLLGVPR